MSRSRTSNPYCAPCAGSYVEDTGEVSWLVSDALRMEVPIPVICQSVMQLFASRDERQVSRVAFSEPPYGDRDIEPVVLRDGRVQGFSYLASAPDHAPNA